MFRVTHNGYKSEYFNTADEVEGFIAKTLEPYQHLNPKEIFRGYGADNKAENHSRTGTIKSVVIWQYSTLYTEVFMIEEREVQS